MEVFLWLTTRPGPKKSGSNGKTRKNQNSGSWAWTRTPSSGSTPTTGACSSLTGGSYEPQVDLGEWLYSFPAEDTVLPIYTVHALLGAIDDRAAAPDPHCHRPQNAGGCLSENLRLHDPGDRAKAGAFPQGAEPADAEAAKKIKKILERVKLFAPSRRL